jgi:hypothetical protein
VVVYPVPPGHLDENKRSGIEKFNEIQRKTKKIEEWILITALIVNIRWNIMLKVEFYACNLFLLQIQDYVLNSSVEPA